MLKSFKGSIGIGLRNFTTDKDTKIPTLGIVSCRKDQTNLLFEIAQGNGTKMDKASVSREKFAFRLHATKERFYLYR